MSILGMLQHLNIPVEELLANYGKEEANNSDESSDTEDVSEGAKKTVGERIPYYPNLRYHVAEKIRGKSVHGADVSGGGSDKRASDQAVATPLY